MSTHYMGFELETIEHDDGGLWSCKIRNGGRYFAQSAGGWVRSEAAALGRAKIVVQRMHEDRRYRLARASRLAAQKATA